MIEQEFEYRYCMPRNKRSQLKIKITKFLPVWPFPRVFSNRYGPTCWWFSVVVVLFSFCMFIVSVPFTLVWVADRLAYPWVLDDCSFRLLQDGFISLYSNLIIYYTVLSVVVGIGTYINHMSIKSLFDRSISSEIEEREFKLLISSFFFRKFMDLLDGLFRFIVHKVKVIDVIHCEQTNVRNISQRCELSLKHIDGY